MTMALSYLAYAAASIAATAWVGHALKKHGALMLARRDSEEMATALSALLATGFYLFHVGFALLILRYGARAETSAEGIEAVSTRLGLVLLVLAASHFIHVAAYARGRQRDPLPVSADRSNGQEEPVTAEIVRDMP